MGQERIASSLCRQSKTRDRAPPNRRTDVVAYDHEESKRSTTRRYPSKVWKGAKTKKAGLMKAPMVPKRIEISGRKKKVRDLNKIQESCATVE